MLTVVKRKDKFLDNYKLQVVLLSYRIENKLPHNAVSDARATKYVGLIPENGVAKGIHYCIPHVCGVDPPEKACFSTAFWYSPRMWG